MSNISIYQIEHEYLTLVEDIINSGGEITPEQEMQLALTKDQLENKGRSYGYVVKQLESDCDQIDAEISRLQALKKSRNKTIDKLKETLTNAMNLFEVTEIKTPTLKINFRKSETVEVESLIIDEKWCTSKTTIMPDKTRIKEALKNGEVILGAELVQHQNIQIK